MYLSELATEVSLFCGSSVRVPHVRIGYWSLRLGLPRWGRLEGGKKKKPQIFLRLLGAVRTGLEPATPGVTGRYSNQLNYRTILVLFPFGIANIGGFFVTANFFFRFIQKK